MLASVNISADWDHRDMDHRNGFGHGGEGGWEGHHGYGGHRGYGYNGNLWRNCYYTDTTIFPALYSTTVTI